MTPIFVIATLIMLQIAGYIFIHRNKEKKWKYVVFTTILLLNFFIIPFCYFSEIPAKDPVCGMPVLAITLGFWIIGGGLIIFTHLTYNLLTQILMIKSQV